MQNPRTESPPLHDDPSFLRSLLAASDDCIKVLALDGTLSFMSEGGRRVMEVSDFNAVQGCPWPDFWQDEGNAAARLAIEEARAGRSCRFVAQADTARGRPRWWDVKVSPILGDDGRPHSILSISRDVTELKQSEEQQRLLALELKHRIKNSIAMIQSIANQTLRPGELTVDAKAALMERLGTMAAAQDLMTQSAWSQARLHELIGKAIEPHAVADRVTCDGPEIGLGSRCALAMSLALHELTTNAIKYGALSRDEGCVSVSWTVEDGPDRAGFRLQWRESGGPAVQAPTRVGFGSRMIERVLASYFRGTAAIDYAPVGLVFTLRAPLEALTAE